MQDKIVWITGASSGIGEALTVELSRKGATLILSARKEQALREVRSICKNPENHLVVPLDLADLNTISNAVKTVQDRFERVDVLINNGGVSQRAHAVETTIAVDRRIMDINYLGTVALTKELLPGMLTQKAGHIVVVSSVVGKFGTPYRTAYAASKHALHGFFDSLRAELWSQGIVITLVCPGYVHTNLSINALAGNGSLFGKMDDATAQGMTPHYCARILIEAIERKKEEVYIGRKEVLGVYLKRYLPALFSRIIRVVKVR
ncbi:SDR family oxidoreductase [candidate division CSSED10-310 bacterium]|uniref:SDR family oxidoreductase n=1 Tax=candidate division CSSED10-310 bacterium TaxID=2855610 RepID=A0ABV6YTL9_UNCC1